MYFSYMEVGCYVNLHQYAEKSKYFDTIRQSDHDFKTSRNE